MKNILVTATTFPRWENDKEATFVKDLSFEFLKKGNDVKILVPHYKNLKRKDYMGGLEVYRFKYAPSYFEKLAYGSMIQNIKKNHFVTLLIPSFVLSELVCAFRIIKKYKIDIVHSHWIIPQGFVGSILKKFFDIKHLVTIHAADILLLNRLPFKKLISGFIVRNSEGIACVSTHGKNTLLNMLSKKDAEIAKDKIKLLPMGVHIDSFDIKKTTLQIKKEKNIETNKKVILFVGRLADKKGMNYLIDAMTLLDKNFLLIIVGDGPLKHTLEEQVRSLKLTDRIRFEGYKVGEEKNEYFVISDIFVIPSIVDKSGDTEGLPVVLLEALAAGKPVIASNVGGIPDIIIDGHNGLLVPEKDAKIIAEKIKYLSSNKEISKKLSVNACKEASKYDWKIVGENYIKFFEEI